MGLTPESFSAMNINTFYAILEGHRMKRESDDFRTSYFLRSLARILVGNKDAGKLFEETYYGLHPDDMPDRAKEKNDYMKQFNLM